MDNYLHYFGSYLLKMLSDGLPSLIGGTITFLTFFFFLSPKIKFASLRFDPTPSNQFSDEYPCQYKIGIKNISAHIPGLIGHTIYDVSIQARLTVPISEKKTVFFDIQVDNQLDFRIPALPVTIKNRFRWYTLCYRNARGLDERQVRELGLPENYSLRDFLNIQGAYLTVYISGRGQFTGQVKDFEAKYLASDIQEK